MALMLLQVLVLGVIAAAADDVPLTWYWGARALVPCSLPGARVLPRRPPPPLDAERTRPQRMYTWFKDGEEYQGSRVFSNGTLDIRRSEGGDGVYQCSARTQQGLVLGYPVHLRSAHLDKFTVHPENATAQLGQPVTLSCVISSTPPAVVSWLRDGQSLSADDRYYLLKDQLLITEVRETDVGLYRCRATNTVLNKSVMSRGGRLHVGPSSPREPEFLATFEGRDLAAPEGAAGLLPCPVAGWPRPEITWELNTAGSFVSLDGGQVLERSDLDLQMQGVYTCRVRGRGDLEKSFNVTVTRPVNITMPPSSKQAPRASTVRLACSADGRPAPNVTWYKDGSPLALIERIGLRKSYPEEDRIELVISSVTSEDAGVYQCFASNNVSVSSAWAALTVTGSDAAPPHRVTCEPVDAREVLVRWLPAQEPVVAYTVHTTRQDIVGSSLPGQPHKNTQEVVTVAEALTPYKFEVRAYIQSMKNMATDFSEGVVCQGQGVPIQLEKLNSSSVLVSWQRFAAETPGVAQWLLQARAGDGAPINVTLDAGATSYMLTLPEDCALEVRVLGTRSLPWLQQDLSQVPWYSASDSGDGVSAPRDLEVMQVTARGFTMRWKTDQPQKHFLVCVTKVDGIEECQLSDMNSITIENLQPASEYEVRVQTKVPGREAAETALSYHVITLPEGPSLFKDITHKFVNASTLRVSWGGAPGRYTVQHTSDVNKAKELWSAVTTMGNTVLITGIQPGDTTFLKVTGYEPPAQSQIITVPPVFNDPDVKNLSYVYTSGGISVSWSGAGPRVVRFAQNITRPLEAWHRVNVTETHVQLAGLDPSLPTFVTVTAPGSSRPSQVLTIPARPHDMSAVSIGVGVGCLVCVLLLMAVAAFCIWRKRKMAESPVRSRRRNMASTEGHEGESSEMKSVGGRLANGGAAGEPLLNGHVHIIENPTSKTPNGKMRKPRYEPFDLSRHDPDTTAETLLDDSAPYLLDTSRRPDDASRSLSTNNSFNKLPDDNMNSEITRSTDFGLDNSKIQPTLQPNG